VASVGYLNLNCNHVGFEFPSNLGSNPSSGLHFGASGRTQRKVLCRCGFESAFRLLFALKKSPHNLMWANNSATPQHHRAINNNNNAKKKQPRSDHSNCGSTSSELFVCPNRLCNHTMTSQQGWVNHYLQHSDCFKAEGGSTVFWERRATEMRVDHTQQAFVETNTPRQRFGN
jgi:hypothetical protein